MVREGRLSRFLALALVTVVIAVQGIAIGTAAFADYREKEKQTAAYVGEPAESRIYQPVNYKLDNHKAEKFDQVKHKQEILDQGKHKQEILDRLAQDYNVEKEYIYYIAEIENMFKLEPYELLALIAQESKFVPQTKMDGGSYSYNTTQMKLDTAKTAYMAITEYYHHDIPVPTHELLAEDKYYAALLAGGYLKYLRDTYQNKYEAYTAYHRGIGGRLAYYAKNGHFKSPYALQVADLSTAFAGGKTNLKGQ